MDHGLQQRLHHAAPALRDLVHGRPADPRHHYVEVRDDFSDLEEKIEALEADPMRAREIVANANRHIGTFLQRRNEKLTSLLVLQKYFEATEQLPPSAFTEGFFSVIEAEPRMC